MPKPASACPSERARSVRPASISMAPIPTKGREKVSILKPKPSIATSHAFIVEPRFEPNMTHKAFFSGSRPVLTKPMLAMVTAVDDCTSAVIR